MEKLADGLQKLGEDDLLQVVTMVHDNKSHETYTKNDVESMSIVRDDWSCTLLTNYSAQMASSTSTSTLCPTRW